MQLINARNMEHQTVQGQIYKRGVLISHQFVRI